MKSNLTRREFLRRSALAAAIAPAFIRNLRAAPPSGTVLHAAIGAGNQGAADLTRLSSHPFIKIVAIADVDRSKSAPWRAKFPNVRIYDDWRELLAKEKQLDSVDVATPDHMHAAIAMSAMQLGRHVYVEKPLAHDLYEARRLTEFAREKKLVTQMGIQIHSASDYRMAVRLVQEGAIGKVKEVHSWCGKGWGDATAKPNRIDPVPEGFNWDLWLGTAAKRPFIGNGYYHPANWRKRVDFGTGTFGDMGCHILDPVFSALELTAPLSIGSAGTPPNEWNWANDAKVHYVFPGTPHTEGKLINVTWYDGDQLPPKEVLALAPVENRPGCGSIFIGTKGVMLLPHVAKPQLFPEKDFADFKMPRVEDGNHYTTFLEAVRGNTKTTANFNYTGPLTETVLLGGVAARFPQTTLDWDAKKLKFTNLSKANKYLRRTYRRGWRVKGLS